MPPILYAHPFSSYCMKALIALYETGLAFDYRIVDADHPHHAAALKAVSPAGKFPVLVADGAVLLEASIVVEWVDARAGAGFIPADPAAARMLDRVFDNYVMAPMQAIVADALRPPGAHDAIGVAQARAMLDRSYAWLDAALAGRMWAAGAAFGLADIAAAPALLYADWVHAIPPALTTLAAYRARALARPAIARTVDEARPFRALFPWPVPDGRG